MAAQLRALMERPHLTPRDLERLTQRPNLPPVSAVTVRRILKGEARTEPEPGTLRRVAEAAGESHLVAFAESDAEGIVTIEVAQRGGRFFLHFVGGALPAELEAALRKVLDRYEKSLRVGSSGQGSGLRRV